MIDDTLPPNLFSGIKVQDFQIATDDHVWTCKVAIGEFLNLLKDPHTWVASRILIKNKDGNSARPAILSDHFVIYFQDMPTTNQGLADQQILVHGIDSTSALTVHLCKGAMESALADANGRLGFSFFSGNSFLKDFSRSMASAFGKAMIPFLPDLNPASLPEVEKSTEPMRVHTIEDRVYAHAEIGKQRQVVAAHLFGGAVLTDRYLADMNANHAQVPMGKGAADALKTDERLSFEKKTSTASTISFIYQGQKVTKADVPAGEFAESVCNIVGGTGSRVVTVDYVIAKAYTTPPPPGP